MYISGLLLVFVSVSAGFAETQVVDLFPKLFNANATCFSLVFSNVSATCAYQLNEACRNQSLIAEFFDASSKFPYTAMIPSSKLDFGSYDQCLAIDYAYNEDRIRGKYCLAGLLLVLDPKAIDPYQLSTCMLEGCSAQDYNTIFNTLFSGKFPGLFQDSTCVDQYTGKEFTASDITTTGIIALSVSLMIACTVYDMHLKREKKKSLHPLLLSFSVYTNGKKLLQTSKRHREQILVFHGLKVISMLWIIAGHGITGWNNLSLMNKDAVTNYAENNFYSFYVFAAPLAVDTFFYISGFLMAYQYLKMKSKPLKLQVFSVPQMYIHRYFRLTPAVVMVFLVNLSVFSHLGKGPLWQNGIKLIQEPCKKYWWTFFLYIQNYVNYTEEDLCVLPTWYLSADMQMFLIAPFVLIPLAVALTRPKMFKTCMILLTVFNLILTVIPIIIAYCIKDYFNNYDTHSRLMVYFIGIMMGTLMREKIDMPFLGNNATDNSRSVFNILLWIVALLLMGLRAIYHREVRITLDNNGILAFDCVSRTVWSICLSWIVYSCHRGYGGIINWFLTRRIMQIGGKLCYCIYLVHGLVIANNILQIRTRLYFNDYMVFYFFCGYVVWSVLLAFFWTLAFESPLIAIERFVFGKDLPNKSKQPKTNPSVSDKTKEP